MTSAHRFRRRLGLAAIAILSAAATFVVIGWLPARSDGGADGDDASAGPTSISSEVATSPHAQHTEEVGPTSDADRATTDDLLAQATDRLDVRTVADALEAGYEITNTEEGPNDVHLAKPSIIDDRFDPLEPEMLLATSREDDGEILALVWWVEVDDAPEGFPGGDDRWHLHDAFCAVDGAVADMSPAECAERGGTVATEGGWMLHAWVLPGRPNPEGRFAADNPSVTPDRGT